MYIESDPTATVWKGTAQDREFHHCIHARRSSAMPQTITADKTHQQYWLEYETSGGKQRRPVRQLTVNFKFPDHYKTRRSSTTTTNQITSKKISGKVGRIC